MPNQIDYQAVLADLEEKRDQIDAAIAGIRLMLGAVADAPENGGIALSPQKPDQGPKQPPKAAANGVAVQSDTFFQMSTSAAIRKFLAIAKRPQTPRAIADALHVGGQVHAVDAKTAYTNVYTALRRGQDSEFSQTRNGEWGLAEWYSNKPKGEGE